MSYPGSPSRVSYSPGKRMRDSPLQLSVSRSPARKVPRLNLSVRRQGNPFSPAGFFRREGYYGRFLRGGELKFLDTVVTLGNVATAGTLSTTLCAVPQDDSASGRDGRQITIKKISYHGQLTTDGTALNQERIRIVVVQDKQTNGALGTVLNVLQTADANSFRNLENIHRFNVLKDFEVPMPPKTVNTAATTAMAQLIPIKFSLNCNIIVDYDSSASTGVVSTQRSNGIFMFAISGGSATADIAGICRIRYADK